MSCLLGRRICCFVPGDISMPRHPTKGELEARALRFEIAHRCMENVSEVAAGPWCT